MQTDILVIGGGLAGYTAAWEAARRGTLRVSLLKTGAGSSPYIHGLCIPLHEEDSPELFYQDTMASGYSQSDPALVKKLCGDSLGLLDYFRELGFAPDRDGNGVRLLQPLGASKPRVVFIQNDSGPSLLGELRSRLLRLDNYREHGTLRALELVVENDRAAGVRCFDTKTHTWLTYRANTVILATGGFCGIFPFSTNSRDIGGDGIAMACRAGVGLVDMEFIQFEPSVSVWPPQTAGKGVITTMFYDGAVLRNSRGERFLCAYGQEAEQIPKDVMARHIDKELKKGGGGIHGGVFMDATGVPREKLMTSYRPYVNRYAACGVDITREYMELRPAPHTSCGGIVISPDCRTELPGLLACGEVTGGVHGANRLGGNAGLETLVFGRQAGRTALEYTEPCRNADDQESENRPWVNDSGEARKLLHEALEEGLPVVRDEKGLRLALEKLEYAQALLGIGAGCYEKTRLLGDCLTARLALGSALERTETVGCHVRSDGTAPGDKYRVAARWSGGRAKVSREKLRWTE